LPQLTIANIKQKSNRKAYLAPDISRVVLFTILDMKKLPAIFACIHFLFAGLIFGLAIANPQRSGLMPILIFAIDLPWSFVLQWLGSIPPHASLAIDAAQYLTLGSAWWYFLGSLIRVAYWRFQASRVS
jgi:hypothetical protein